MFIAAFTIAYARLTLYDHKEKVAAPKRNLYYYSDSLRYVVRQGQTPLPIGNYLDRLMDDLGVDFITEIVAAGPKGYRHLTKYVKAVMPIKVITQTL